MRAWLVVIRCKYCERVHCEASSGCKVKFRCRKCKRIQIVTAGQ